MNQNDETKARNAADAMIVDLLKMQPEMIKPGALNEDSGKAVGKFISSLREQLTVMYQQKPR